MKAMKSNEVIAKLNERKDRSAWDKAVTAYAVEIVEAMSADGEQEISRESLPLALNGAENWYRYSEGACSLVWDEDIARRVCTPSEFKRKRGGELPPAGGGTWISVQGRALAQAWRRIVKTIALA